MRRSKQRQAEASRGKQRQARRTQHVYLWQCLLRANANSVLRRNITQAWQAVTANLQKDDCRDCQHIYHGNGVQHRQPQLHQGTSAAASLKGVGWAFILVALLQSSSRCYRQGLVQIQDVAASSQASVVSGNLNSPGVIAVSGWWTSGNKAGLLPGTPWAGMVSGRDVKRQVSVMTAGLARSGAPVKPPSQACLPPPLYY
jgi:hypothetical protein